MSGKWVHLCDDDKATTFICSLNILKQSVENSMQEGTPTGRKLIDALLFLLHHCGDFEVQKHIVDAVVAILELYDFNDWFAEALFTKYQTQLLFSQLHTNNTSLSKDVRKFLLCFNKNECDLPRVLSLRCLAASWNSDSLSWPTDEREFWLDFNLGSKTLTLCVKELPSFYAEHASLPKCTSVCIELQNKFLLDIVVVPEKPYSSLKDLKLLEIKTTTGNLSVLVDTMGNDSELAEVLTMWANIIKINSNRMEEKFTFSAMGSNESSSPILRSLSAVCKRLLTVLNNLGLPAPEYLLPLNKRCADSVFNHQCVQDVPYGTYPNSVSSLKLHFQHRSKAALVTESNHAVTVCPSSEVEEQFECDSVHMITSSSEERIQNEFITKSELDNKITAFNCLEAVKMDQGTTFPELEMYKANKMQKKYSDNLPIQTAFSADDFSSAVFKAQNKDLHPNPRDLESCDLLSTEISDENIEREKGDRDIAAIALVLLSCSLD